MKLNKEKSLFIKVIHYSFSFQASSKCELNCIPKGENFYYRHKNAVLDGTPCEPGRRDICVEGVCKVRYLNFYYIIEYIRLYKKHSLFFSSIQSIKKGEFTLLVINLLTNYLFFFFITS